jgi:transcriptional regulator with XRE-family HTH domain
VTAVKFGELLKQLRTEAGMSQRDLAARLGVDFTYISKLENGKTDYAPSQKILREIAALFGVDGDWLIFKAGKIPSQYHTLLEQLALKYGTALPSRLQQLVDEEQEHE